MDSEVRVPVMVNKAACLTKAFMLLVSDTGFHGRLILCGGSERQNVSSKGRKDKELETEAQSRMRSQDRCMRRETGMGRKDPERGTGKTAGESAHGGHASITDRRLSASRLPSHSANMGVLLLHTCPLEKAASGQKQ